MSKEALVYQTEADLKRLAECGFKLLFTTHGFRLLGIVTFDRLLPDESLGLKRRRIKGLVIENGTPLSPEERIFDTFLDRKNPRSGQLDKIVVHEDDFMILMERKTFELSDEDDNFQFIPNMHMMNHVQQLKDNIDAASRRIVRLRDEKQQFFLDSEHFKREAATSKESERSKGELLNRLTRENSRMQEKLGNLEASNQNLRAKNLEYEGYMDEKMSNATETGTLKAMTLHDLMIHAAEKENDLALAMHEIGPDEAGMSERVQGLQKDVSEIKAILLEKLEKESVKQKVPGPGA